MLYFFEYEKSVNKEEGEDRTEEEQGEGERSLAMLIGCSLFIIFCFLCFFITSRLLLCYHSLKSFLLLFCCSFCIFIVEVERE